MDRCGGDHDEVAVAGASRSTGSTTGPAPRTPVRFVCDNVDHDPGILRCITHDPDSDDKGTCMTGPRSQPHAHNLTAQIAWISQYRLRVLSTVGLE